LSKFYHPDTTTLPPAIATAKFQELNEAYATLSNPERRLAYDQKIGYSRIPVMQPLPALSISSGLNRPVSSSAYLDPTDRPLSPGELFALFILGITFAACLVLAITIGLTRGEQTLIHPESALRLPVTEIQQVVDHPSIPASPPASKAMSSKKLELSSKQTTLTKTTVKALPGASAKPSIPSSSRSE
jgi:hypothetical protein